MTEERPEPLTPPDCDVRPFDGFMLDVDKLMASELWAMSSGDEFKAAIALWCKAWKQVPAASLPNDERVLAAFSGAGSKWRKVRQVALHGFVLCSDGRLYHPVLAADALRASRARKQRQEAIAARWGDRGQEQDGHGKNVRPKHDRNTKPATSVPTEPIRPYYDSDTRDGTGKKKEEASASSPTAARPSGDAAAGLIARVDRIIVEVWGEAQARAWPHQTDRATALGWIEAGVDEEAMADAVNAVCRRMAATGKPPPGLLRYFDRPVRETVATGGPGSPVGGPAIAPADEIPGCVVTHSDRVWWGRLRWIADHGGTWVEDWGPPPGERGCLCPAALLEADRAMGRKADAA